MAAPLTTRARAKVNLDLKVLGRRSDGYHELESLVAFAGVGDLLTLEPGPELSLTIAGPRGAGLEADERNLVLRAARILAREIDPLRWGHFHLVKRLPVASGIGGGSADAAAALRLLARLNGFSLNEPALLRAASQVGADVPVCLESRARVMTGVGERLGPALRLPRLFAVLVNPGVPIETAAVFRELGLLPGQVPPASPTPASPLGDDSREALLDRLGCSSNDLEPPALRIAPLLRDLLARLRDLPNCRLARMSGSGATCFAVFDDCRQSADAAKLLAREQSGWWVRPTVLR
jgi:4-diphosphocytidyl-2-C-methyl-D-erythritol kinase